VIQIMDGAIYFGVGKIDEIRLCRSFSGPSPRMTC